MRISSAILCLPTAATASRAAGKSRYARWLLLSLCWSLGVAPAQVAPPDSLVLDGIPPLPSDLQTRAARYLEFRAAAFEDWHPVRKEILIATRFADSAQLHLVKMPGGARHQLTFSPEPIAGGSFRPRTGDCIVLAQDLGGGEFFQLYRYEPSGGELTLLTDGKSRNLGARWSHSGKRLAYTSTRRNGKDTDLYVMDPANRATDRLVLQVSGGGWTIQDWSRDESTLLIAERLSISKSHLYLLDLNTGACRQITPELQIPAAYENARFAADHRSIFVTTDRDSEFQRLVEFALPHPGSTVEQPSRVLSGALNWDVDEFDLSEDGERIAYVANEAGIGILHVLETRAGKERPLPKLPVGIVSRPSWHENNRDLAFNISSAKAPADVFSLDAGSGKIERWTESEVGGLDTARFVEPELAKFKSFDGQEITAFIYRPDARKFAGKRPVLINIHGGPEAQFRPGFQARNNYLLNELGLALVFPNVRGSSGYGKTFLTLDNGFKREDSVKDIGALIDYLARDPGLDADRFGVIGGSYGGYMVLSSMARFNDRLRCGVDIVGISNFLTFLKNTQDYRRDLRRVEYGDERDPAMNEFLHRISPTTNVDKIKKPLLVVQGQNDPRVPVTEAAQMVKAIRDHGGLVWYLVAKDEGHGFAKKKNADFQFLATLAFLQEHLVK
jgi:dipeptidyl aminopeptidase/acylaminoacyl peptidase